MEPFVEDYYPKFNEDKIKTDHPIDVDIKRNKEKIIEEEYNDKSMDIYDDYKLVKDDKATEVVNNNIHNQKQLMK